MSDISTNAERLRTMGKDERLILQDKTNFEMPIDLAEDFITPTELFFIRSNGPESALEIDPASWSLTITGCVDREVTIDLPTLQTMPARSYTAFLECSGNSRNRFGRQGGGKVEGTDWGEGAVGNATWTGVPLRDVLAIAGVRADAVEIVAQGADFEGMQRAIPIDVATNGDVLLAWEMNGQPLLPAHGGPVRMIVPGWGAIASTKWLASLTLIDHPFDGYWNADNYVLYDETGAAIGPVQRMPVKSVIVSPKDGTTIDSSPITVHGFAWSGHGAIASVEYSDDGKIWHTATITRQDGPFSWTAFAFDWSPESGVQRIMSRATDTAGNVQPETATWNRKGYQMNAIRPVTITRSLKCALPSDSRPIRGHSSPTHTPNRQPKLPSCLDWIWLYQSRDRLQPQECLLCRDMNNPSIRQ